MSFLECSISLELLRLMFPQNESEIIVTCWHFYMQRNNNGKSGPIPPERQIYS